MHARAVVLAAYLLGGGTVSAQLNKLAQEAGKKYFGTATDNGELSNTTYFDILTNRSEFGQLTPSNGQKVRSVPPLGGMDVQMPSLSWSIVKASVETQD